MAAGSDRIVEVYDSRMWRLTLKWRTQCKYDVVHMLPASFTDRNRSVYLCGLDNEMLLSDVTIPESKKKAASAGDHTERKRKIDDDEGLVSRSEPSGPAHAPLPESSKLRLSHHRFIFKF